MPLWLVRRRTVVWVSACWFGSMQRSRSQVLLLQWAQTGVIRLSDRVVQSRPQRWLASGNSLDRGCLLRHGKGIPSRADEAANPSTRDNPSTRKESGGRHAGVCAEQLLHSLLLPVHAVAHFSPSSVVIVATGLRSGLGRVLAAQKFSIATMSSSDVASRRRARCGSRMITLPLRTHVSSCSMAR